MPITRPRRVIALSVLVGSTALLVAPACGFIENDRSEQPPITTTTEPGRTTLPPGPKTPISPTDVCGLLDQPTVAAAGIDAQLGEPKDVSDGYTLQTLGNEAACQWYLRDDVKISTITVAVATGAGSADFESTLAAPGVGDPFTIDGLGDLAAAVTERAGLRSNDGTAYVLVLTKGKLLKIESLNAMLTPVDSLEKMARTLLPKLG